MRIWFIKFLKKKKQVFNDNDELRERPIISIIKSMNPFDEKKKKKQWFASAIFDKETRSLNRKILNYIIRASLNIKRRRISLVSIEIFTAWFLEANTKDHSKFWIHLRGSFEFSDNRYQFKYVMLFTIISFGSMIDRWAFAHFISFIAIVFDDEPVEAGDIVVFIIMNIFGAVVFILLRLYVAMMILRLSRLEIFVVISICVTISLLYFCPEYS